MDFCSFGAGFILITFIIEKVKANKDEKKALADAVGRVANLENVSEELDTQPLL